MIMHYFLQQTIYLVYMTNVVIMTGHFMISYFLKKKNSLFIKISIVLILVLSSLLTSHGVFYVSTK